MLYSRLLVLAAIIVVLFVDISAPAPDIFRHAGFALICLCAMGRLYTTMFIGGHKNDSLITIGPYSMIRHPLYFFSLLGMTGVAFISGNLAVILAFPPAFVLLYFSLMKREEEFLLAKFGNDYERYAARTGRFIPRFSQYAAPDSIVAKPAYVRNAFADALWWFAAVPIMELVVYLKAQVEWI